MCHLSGGFYTRDLLRWVNWDQAHELVCLTELAVAQIIAVMRFAIGWSAALILQAVMVFLYCVKIDEVIVMSGSIESTEFMEVIIFNWFKLLTWFSSGSIV